MAMSKQERNWGIGLSAVMGILGTALYLIIPPMTPDERVGCRYEFGHNEEIVVLDATARHLIVVRRGDAGSDTVRLSGREFIRMTVGRDCLR